MTAKGARAEIQNFTLALYRANIAIDIKSTVELHAGVRTMVTWAGAALRSPFLPRSDFATIQEYRRLLIETQYSCVLYDGSLLQLSYQFERDVIVSHRLVYFPCPLAFGASDLAPSEGFAVLEVFDARLSEELERIASSIDDRPRADLDTGAESPRLRLRSPLRFDYDLEAMAEGHPGSHLHIADEHVRWAAFGPLSVGHFARFVFRHYYPSEWTGQSFLRNWPIRIGARSVVTGEEQELFIECHHARGRDVA